MGNLFEGDNNMGIILGNSITQVIGKIRKLQPGLVIGLFLDLDKEGPETHGQKEGLLMFMVNKAEEFPDELL